MGDAIWNTDDRSELRSSFQLLIFRIEHCNAMYSPRSPEKLGGSAEPLGPNKENEVCCKAGTLLCRIADAKTHFGRDIDGTGKN